MPESVQFDRRRHPRYESIQFGRIYDARIGRFVACTTRNISRGGVLIELAREVPFEVGDRAIMSLASNDPAGILQPNRCLEVEVVRADAESDGRQSVAVRFIAANEARADALLVAA